MTVKRMLAAGEESQKRMKLDQDLLKEITKNQEELTSLENEVLKEQMKLQQSHDVKKQTPLGARGELFKKIPDFWRTIFSNMTSLCKDGSISMPEAELKMIDYLDDVKVEEMIDVEKRMHKFTFMFRENPFFKETALEKSVWDGAEDNTTEMTIPEITWIENPLDKEEGAEKDEEETMSFFEWLTSELSVGDDFGLIFRDKVWTNPMDVYEMEDDSEEDDDDDDDDDEDEAEEAEGDAPTA